MAEDRHGDLAQRESSQGQSDANDLDQSKGTGPHEQQASSS